MMNQSQESLMNDSMCAATADTQKKGGSRAQKSPDVAETVQCSKEASAVSAAKGSVESTEGMTPQNQAAEKTLNNTHASQDELSQALGATTDRGDHFAK